MTCVNRLLFLIMEEWKNKDWEMLASQGLDSALLEADCLKGTL